MTGDCSVILEDVACPLGCPSGDVPVLTGRDRLHNLPGEFTVVRCTTCGLMRTTPRPTPETIGLYYPDDYGPYVGTQVNQATHPQTSWVAKLAGFIYGFFNFNTEILPSLFPGRLLEIGCASGSFLHRLAGQGWDVQGIEFSEKAAQAARRLGYCVHSGPLETAPDPEQPFDLIVGWMVMEHLHDPVRCLSKLLEWAKPGAYLVLSVPDAGSSEFRFFKEKWYDLHLPNHLYHFTPETLGRVLAEAGWKMESIHHHRLLSNLIASTGYMLQDAAFTRLGQKLIDFPEHAGRWPFVLYPLAWFLSLFGQTGRMTVWAKKVS